MKTQTIKPVRPPRVAPSGVPMDTTAQRKPGRPLRVTLNEMPMEHQEKGNLGDLQGWHQINRLR